MDQDNQNPLHIIQEKKDPVDPKPEERPQDPPKESERSFTLPESYLLAQEMRSLFDEDIVTHVQGPSEPEAE